MSRQRPERVIQFGTGRLVRAFADFFIHRANQQGDFDGSVVCVQSTGSGRAHLLNDQDGRFNLWERGIDGGETVDRFERIESISRVIPANDDWESVLDCARNRDIRFIVSNASEIGVVFDESDRIDANPPRSFPGKLTAVLYERAVASDFSDDAGFVILPCELLEDNGDELRRIVHALAEAWGLGQDFQTWIDRANLFCNTLVDRIVTGTPPDRDLEESRSRLGYDDPLVTVAEPYRLWAIEGGADLSARIPFARSDRGIVVADDIAPYRERKLRLLNGGHTISVPLGILSGNSSILEHMENTATSHFVEGVLREEIGPTVPVDPATVGPYIDEILERWRNPFLNHRLTDIAWQSTSKMKYRVVPSILRYYDRFGAVPKRIAKGFAAYLIVMKPEFKIDDAQAEVIRDAWRNAGDAGRESIGRLTNAVCARAELWGADLSALPGFSDEVGAQVEVLLDSTD